MRQKDYFSDFKYVKDVGVRWTRLIVLETADLLGFFHTNISRFTKDKNKKIVKMPNNDQIALS